MQRHFEIDLTCPKCKQSGIVKYREEDQTGKTTLCVKASGNWLLQDDGTKACKCEVANA